MASKLCLAKNVRMSSFSYWPSFFFCIGRLYSVLADFFLYWPSFFSVLAEFAIGMKRADFAIQMLY